MIKGCDIMIVNVYDINGQNITDNIENFVIENDDYYKTIYKIRQEIKDKYLQHVNN